MTTLSNLKEVAEEGLRLYSLYKPPHPLECGAWDRDGQCGCGLDEAWSGVMYHAEKNHINLCTAFLESIKRIEELEKQKAHAVAATILECLDVVQELDVDSLDFKNRAGAWDLREMAENAIREHYRKHIIQMQAAGALPKGEE